ncbi:MAG: hypothetical protein Q8M94_02820 [Ignavibacteria bacterium]|nr:hypothetical protein [Ignavibacteria bacterium]
MKIIGKHPLATNILAVATEGGAEDWTAYIGVVPGINHGKEEQESVARTGEKLPKDIATLLFPDIAERLTWRD